MPNFSKRFTNYFYEFQRSEKYISNYSQILQKLKKNKIHTRRWERRDCRRVFRVHVHVLGRDTGTGMIACLTLKPSGRTHRDASHARSRQHDRRRGEADASASHGPKQVDNNRQINRLIISLSVSVLLFTFVKEEGHATPNPPESPVTIQDWFLLALVLDLGAKVIKGVAQ